MWYSGSRWPLAKMFDQSIRGLAVAMMSLMVINLASNFNVVDSIAVAVPTGDPAIDAAIRETPQRDTDLYRPQQQLQQQHVVNDDDGELIDNDLEPGVVGDDDIASDHPSAVAPPVQPYPFPPVPGPVKVRQCEPIQIDLCYGLGYNVTGFPNLAGHDSAADAEQQLRTFSPLIKYECSSNGELRLFLCAVYVPMCTEQFPEVIGPCRSVCERVRRRCEPVLQHFGFPWPAALRCDNFHARNNVDDHMCMEGPEGSSDDDDDIDDQGGNAGAIDPPRNCGSNAAAGPGCADTDATRCAEHSAAVGNATESSSSSSSSSSSQLVYVWTAVWSVSAALSTLFVIVTFTIDAARYSYADRVVLLAAACSAICAVAHLSRLAFVNGENIATPSSPSPITDAILQQHQRQQHAPCRPPSLDYEHRLSTAPGEPGSDCTVVFVVVYYFSSAASLWWLVLTVVLALQAGGSTGRGAQQRLWADNDIRRRLSTWFHLFSWSAPAIATIILLVRKEITVDQSLSEAGARPVCRVQAGSGSGLGLVLVPLSACMALGTSMLIVSAIRFRMRRTYRTVNSTYSHQQQQHHHLHQNNEEQPVVVIEGELLKKSKQLIGKQRPHHVPTGAELCERRSSLEKTAASSGIGDDTDEDVGGTVRIAVISVIGAVTIVAAVASLAHEYANKSSSVAAVLVKILSSILVAFVVGPWLVMSGQASASWNSFVLRRRERKVLNPTSSKYLPSRPQCLQCTCNSGRDVSASSNCRRPATSRSARQPAASDGCQHECRQNSTVHQMTGSRYCSDQRRTKSQTASGVPLLTTLHGYCGCAVQQACHEQCLEQLRHQCQLTVARSSTPSHYASSALSSGGPWPAGTSALGAVERVSCKFCRRQHQIVNQQCII